MNIAICEDFEPDAQRLSRLLEQYRRKNQVDFHVALYRSGDALLRNFESARAQIIFLDIYMDGESGIETAKKIRAMDEECALIFITSSREHALEGFAVRATHYLNKPVEYHDVEEAMRRCREQLNRFARSIDLMVDGCLLRVRLCDILYAEVFRKNCVLHTVCGDMHISSSISELARMLEEPCFLRCHRSYIVNLNHVRDISEYRFVLTDGSHALIPVRNYAAMKKRFHAYQFSQFTHP